MSRFFPRHPALRAVVGVLISGAFVAVTMSRVDIEAVADLWGRVEISLVFLAAGVSVAEVTVRARRWRLVLETLADIGFGRALGYLAIGHLANALLPARLGDVARGVLAGTQLRVSRVSVLGTIALERVSDAALLGTAVAIGVLFGFQQMAGTVVIVVAGALVAATVVVAALAVLRGDGMRATRLGKSLLHHGHRFWVGATGLRGGRERAAWVALTITSFSLTAAMLTIVASAVGLTLLPWQAAFVIAAATLSTAIPAGPASIGTYEFVGMTVMVSIGLPAEQSLLTVALVHAAVVLPPAVMGLVAMWWLNVRPSDARAMTRQLPLPERVG